MMRAAYYEAPGPARDVLKVGDLDQPKATAGQVLVRLKASGVNPSDVKSRTGGRGTPTYPLIIPHSDGSGIIEDVGTDIDPARIGQRVWTWNAQWNRPFGTAAEYIALPAAQAVPLPDEVPFEIGACLGVPWVTAWAAVHYSVPADNETMLVAGGAGSVGLYAIQLAKRAGFRVVTSVSSPEKAALATAMGADLVVDYRRGDLSAAVSKFTDGRGVDRIVEVDLAGNAGLYTKLLRKNGLAVVYGSHDWSAPLPLSDWLVRGVQIAFFIVYELSLDIRERAIADSQHVLRDPAFQHVIATRFPLENIVDAHEAVESGKRTGKVIIDIPG